MQKDFVPGYTIFLVNFQTPSQKVNRILRKILPFDGQRNLFDVIYQLKLSLRSPWCFTMQHLIKNEAKCPNIALRAVLNRFEYFYRHVERSADRCLHFNVLDFLLGIEAHIGL